MSNVSYVHEDGSLLEVMFLRYLVYVFCAYFVRTTHCPAQVLAVPALEDTGHRGTPVQCLIIFLGRLTYSCVFSQAGGAA